MDGRNGAASESALLGNDLWAPTLGFHTAIKYLIILSDNTRFVIDSLRLHMSCTCDTEVEAQYMEAEYSANVEACNL
jgi:hypothetical protein